LADDDDGDLPLPGLPIQCIAAAAAPTEVRVTADVPYGHVCVVWRVTLALLVTTMYDMQSMRTVSVLVNRVYKMVASEVSAVHAMKVSVRSHSMTSNSNHLLSTCQSVEAGMPA
jgi:hypothetical protein